MNDVLKDLPDVRGTFRFDYPMAQISWLRTGGTADVLFQPADTQDLQAFLRACPPDLPVFPIGACSNMIIRDGGIRGVVIRMGRGFNGIEILDGGEVRAGSAALDAHVAKRTAEAGIDLAFLRTIPGTVGGAIKMNAGCYGRYIADVVQRIDGLLPDGTAISLTPEEAGFTYRASCLPGGFIITSAVIRGDLDDPDAITERMAAALARRAETQPTKERSCGSTFRNPAGYSSTGRADDVHDLKAWKLIEDAGCRGLRVGGAQMSEMHSNFMINTGTASSADLEDLGEDVRKRVFQKSGISLKWEIMRIGDHPDQ